ncbi:MAG: hypothetical protein M3479_07650, partial [Actinomycetota bacterium]|nr:hypothetical protein [Actinomycetota bacterium]
MGRPMAKNLMEAGY